MQSAGLQRIGDVQAPVKSWLRGLVGDSLSDDDQVLVVVVRTHDEPDPKLRAVAAQDLRGLLAQTAQHAGGLDESEIDAVIDEAMRQVRGR